MLKTKDRGVESIPQWHQILFIFKPPPYLRPSWIRGLQEVNQKIKFRAYIQKTEGLNESIPQWRQILIFKPPPNLRPSWIRGLQEVNQKIKFRAYVPIWTFLVTLNEYFKHLPLLYYPVSGWKAGHNRMEMSVKREDTELKEAQQETESYSFIFHKNRSF